MAALHGGFERSLGCMNRVSGFPCNPGFKQGEVIIHFAELASDLLLWPSEFGMILHNFANV